MRQINDKRAEVPKCVILGNEATWESAPKSVISCTKREKNTLLQIAATAFGALAMIPIKLFRQTKIHFKLISLLLVLALLLTGLPVGAAVQASDYRGGMAGDGVGIYAHGLDLSEWQGTQIDFEKIQAQGYRFVILRAGFATTEDAAFEKNYAAAKDAGLHVGVYLYSYADNAQEAKKEAEACKRWLSGKRLEYPVYFDLEDPKTHGELDPDALSEIALAFLDEMAKDGWLVGLYSCLSWLNYKINTEQVCQNYECWMAQYLLSGSYGIYDRYDEVYGMWQYSSTGNVEGVDGSVDLNVCFKDYPSICQEYGFNGYEVSGENLSLTGATAPEILKLGQSFTPTGKVTSGKGDLTGVTVGIYDELGEMLSGQSVSRLGQSYDLSKLSDSLSTQFLPEGKYVYRITASNVSESRTLLQQVFWVSSSGLHAEGLSSPEDLKSGDDFDLCGYVVSCETLRSVSVTVTDSAGETVLHAEAKPNSPGFDLSNLSSSMSFRTLETGKYQYRVEIRTDSRSVTLCSESFHVWVRSDPVTLSGLTLQAEYLPGDLTELNGLISSQSSDLERVGVMILNADGETVTSASYQNLSGRFDLSICAMKLKLDELTLGRYHLKITAQNAAGPVTLLYQSFLIREDAISLCEFEPPCVVRRGDTFQLSGCVASSSGVLHNVCLQVFDENGNCVLWSAKMPKRNVQDLSDFQDSLLLSSLPCGTYTLCITAENSRCFTSLYEAPFTVTQSDDTLFWENGCILPNCTAYSQSVPMVLWGSLSSGVSEISKLTGEVLDGEGNILLCAQTEPNSRQTSLEDFNALLRLSALPLGEYTLRFTATNASGSYVVLQSFFTVTDCLHRNVRGGNSYAADCTSCGAVCDSQCMDCGGKVRSGALIPKASHRDQNGACALCGRTAFCTVTVTQWEMPTEDNQRFAILGKTGENWYALRMDGTAVAVAAPDASGEIVLSADLLWTLSDSRKGTFLTNPFGQSLHLDSAGISVARGAENRDLSLLFDGQSWSLQASSNATRFLSFDGEAFCTAEECGEIYLFLYLSQR